MKMQASKKKINAEILNELVEAQHKLTSLIDEKGSCGSSVEAKRDVVMYITSWIMPHITDAIKAICGDGRAALACRMNLSFYRHIIGKEIELKDPIQKAKHKPLRGISHSNTEMIFIKKKLVTDLIESAKHPISTNADVTISRVESARSAIALYEKP